MNNDEYFNYLLGYGKGYEEGSSGGGGSNTVVSKTGTSTASFYNIKWQDLVIPDTMTDLGYLFYNVKCTNTPPVVFNSNVTNVEYMYNGSNETKVDMSKWDITNINSFYYTFAASKISELIFPIMHCTASNVNVKSMFYQAQVSGSLDLSGLYIDNASSLDYMFYSCPNLTSIDMRNIKNSTTPTAPYLFYNCTSLTHIDIRGLSIAGIIASKMMTNVPTACEIIVKDATEKAWWNSTFPAYTNVKTVEEYEA